MHENRLKFSNQLTEKLNIILLNITVLGYVYLPLRHPHTTKIHTRFVNFHLHI